MESNTDRNRFLASLVQFLVEYCVFKFGRLNPILAYQDPTDTNTKKYPKIPKIPKKYTEIEKYAKKKNGSVILGLFDSRKNMSRKDVLFFTCPLYSIQ